MSGLKRLRELAPVQSPNSLQSVTDKFLETNRASRHKKRLCQKETTFLFFVVLYNAICPRPVRCKCSYKHPDKHFLKINAPAPPCPLELTPHRDDPFKTDPLPRLREEGKHAFSCTQDEFYGEIRHELSHYQWKGSPHIRIEVRYFYCFLTVGAGLSLVTIGRQHWLRVLFQASFVRLVSK